MLLQYKGREVSLKWVEIQSVTLPPGGSSINVDAVDILRSSGTLSVSLCRGSTGSRLVVGDSVQTANPVPDCREIQPILQQLVKYSMEASASRSDASTGHPPMSYSTH